MQHYGGGATFSLPKPRSNDLELRNRRLPLPTAMHLLTSETEGSPPAPSPPLVISQPHDFTGSRDQDVEEEIHLYEQISTHNRWDSTIMLANVIFYLKDTAKTWFLTHQPWHPGMRARINYISSVTQPAQSSQPSESLLLVPRQPQNLASLTPRTSLLLSKGRPRHDWCRQGCSHLIYLIIDTTSPLGDFVMVGSKQSSLTIH